MSERSSSWGARYLSVWLVSVVRRPWPVVAAALLLAIFSAYFAANNLGVNTDPVQMLDESLPFRETYDRYRREFPDQVQTILVILEAPTPEQAYAAAKMVKAGMAQRSELFPSIDWPQGDEYLQSHGLLFRDVDALNRLGNRLSAAQPMLARISQDPSLPGLLNLLAEAHEREAELGMDFDELDAAIARTIHASVAGRYAPLSWQDLLNGKAAKSGERRSVFRETLIVRPALDYGRVRAGKDALAALREIRRDLHLDEGFVRMYLTGSVALADEELQSVLDGARIAGLLSIIFVSLIMWLGLHSFKQVFIALATLSVGLLLTAGIAAAVVGRVNLVSVAFTVLYVGLGVNYAIHYLLRFRELCMSGMSPNLAVVTAGVNLRGALVLSAVTTAIGFAAFIPTEFKGVAELGLIAAWAMLVTLIVSYSVLPALMAILPTRCNTLTHASSATISPHGERPTASRRGAWVDLPLRYASQLRWGAAVLVILAALVASQVHFDSDPLNLRDAESESVMTLRRLLSERDTGHRNLQVLASNQLEVKKLTTQLRELPEVERVLTLDDFLPDEQDEKLLLLDDLSWVLGPELLSADYAPKERSLEEYQSAVTRLLGALENAEAHVQIALRDALTALTQRYEESGEDGVYRIAGERLLGQLPVTIERLRLALSVHDPITLETMPDNLKRRWLSEQGTYLIQVFPASSATDVSELTGFVSEVQSVAPKATGSPVIQLVSGATISSAFQKAILWAFLGIALLLLILLQSFNAAFKILLPLILGGAVTVALMFVLDIPFNFANLVALPLLLGVGVDNGIHLVYRHRAGQLPKNNVLRTATARGIIFGALTTSLSFGNLAFSSHAGTASLGLVLAMGLALMVLATLLVLPAMLHSKVR